jgi:hypothetical protein
MAKRKTKKRRPGKKKSGWGSRLGTLVTFILFFAILLLILSTLIRWIVPEERDPVFGRDVIRVEVLNGCGDPGVAEKVTDWLRDKGFDIVYYGNADSFDYKETLLFDRSGRPEFARDVGTVLGCERIERKFDGLLLLDVTVIVGKDWRTLNLEETPLGSLESFARGLRKRLDEWLHR